MPDNATDGPSLSRQLPLELVEPPKTDVRDERPDQQIRSLAESIADKGQLQPVLVHPVNPDEHIDDDNDGEGRLEELLAEDHPVRIVDGMTRYLACKQLGRSTVWAVVVPREPDDVVLAQIDANTEGISMDEKEVLETVVEQKEAQGLTWEEIGQRVGLAASTLRSYAYALDAPQYILERWESPESPVERGHVITLRGMRGDEWEQLYEEYTDLGGEAIEAKLRNEQEQMLGWIERHGWAVGETRTRVKNRQRDLREELASDDPTDPQTAGQQQRAEAQETAGTVSAGSNPEGSGGETTTTDVSSVRPSGDDVPDCIVCGETGRQKKAVDCCQEHYGLLSNANNSDEALLSSLEGGSGGGGAGYLPDDPEQLSGSDLVELAKRAGIGPHDLIDSIEAAFGE